MPKYQEKVWSWSMERDKRIPAIKKKGNKPERPKYEGLRRCGNVPPMGDSYTSGAKRLIKGISNIEQGISNVKVRIKRGEKKQDL